MTSQWRDEIPKKVLASMRYCYMPLPSEVNEEEWLGDAESGGARDYLVSLVYNERKKNFIAGYLAGAMAVWEANPVAGKVFSIEDASIGAERAWILKEREDGEVS